MSTSPKVSFGLYNLEINSDSTPSTVSDQQSFSKVEDLKTGNIADLTIATFEQNFWLLNGGYKFLPENEASIHIGFMSLEMSDENGDFSDPPVLEVDFDSIHSSDGLVLHFSQYSNDYADSITVAYYNNRDELITTDNYSPNSWEYEIDKEVSNFKRLVITFHGTNKPYRYLRLTGIDYGQLIHFTGTAIKSASVNEQTNPIGAEIPVNSLNLSIHSTDPQFSIVNPSGYYARFSQRQPLSVYEIVEGIQKFIGRYYLDSWKSPTETEFQFDCIDAVGILDQIPYHGGMWSYEGIKVQYLVDEILQTAAIPYELDADLYDLYVIGWIPSTTCREALKQVAFAIGAYVDCSRSNVVKIYKSPIITGDEVTVPITTSQKSTSQSLELKKLITGIEITGHNYSKGSETLNLYSGSLAEGIYEIPFSEPAHTLSVSGADLIASGVNYAKIRVLSAGAVVITGLKYIDNQQLFSQYDATLNTSVIPNILSVKDATLVNAYNGAIVVARVFSYYQQRYVQKVKTYGETLQIGQVALVDTLNNSQIRGAVEKASIDLAKGFVSNMEIVGVIE